MALKPDLFETIYLIWFIFPVLNYIFEIALLLNVAFYSTFSSVLKNIIALPLQVFYKPEYRPISYKNHSHITGFSGLKLIWILFAIMGIDICEYFVLRMFTFKYYM